jgi:hypothetical protein
MRKAYFLHSGAKMPKSVSVPQSSPSGLIVPRKLDFFKDKCLFKMCTVRLSVSPQEMADMIDYEDHLIKRCIFTPAFFSPGAKTPRSVSVTQSSPTGRSGPQKRRKLRIWSLGGWRWWHREKWHWRNCRDREALRFISEAYLSAMISKLFAFRFRNPIIMQIKALL